MGWWSADVLGGDTPLDALCICEDFLDLEELYPFSAWDEAKRLQVSRSLTRRQAPERLLAELQRFDPQIGPQVLGALALAAGTPLPPRVLEVVLAAVDADEWATEDAERASLMEQLAAALRAFDGTPVSLPHTGLFERINRGY